MQLQRHCGVVWVILVVASLLVVQPVLALQPGYTVQDYIDAAEESMANKQWDFASYQWRNALFLDKKNVKAHLGLAQSLSNAGFPKDAMRHLAEARQEVEDPQLDITLARMLEKAKKPQQAAVLYIQVLKEHPYDAQAFRGLKAVSAKLPRQYQIKLQKFMANSAHQARVKARQALKAGNYRQAAEYYEIAVIHYQKLSVANDHALALFLAGDKTRAAKRLLALDRQIKPDCKVKANTAMVYLALGKARSAEKYMQDALGVCSQPGIKTRLYNNLGYVYEVNKLWTKAQHAYERAVELDPGNTKAKMNLGFIYQRQHQYEKAVTLYKDLVQSQPDNAEAWNQLGFAYEMHFQFKQAYAAYNKAISLDPRLKEAYYNLAMLYKKDGKMEEADANFKRIHEIEFASLENPDQAASRVGEAHSPLFKYVDLFFWEPVL